MQLYRVSDGGDVYTDESGSWHVKINVPDWVTRILVSVVTPAAPVGMGATPPPTYQVAVMSGSPQLVAAVPPIMLNPGGPFTPEVPAHLEYYGVSDQISGRVTLRFEALLTGEMPQPAPDGTEFVDLTPPPPE